MSGVTGLGPRTANTYSTVTTKSYVPTNYVAGVGRGAMGFTTRSDIGPARPAPAVMGMGAPGDASSFGQAPAGYVAGRGRGDKYKIGKFIFIYPLFVPLGMGDLARFQSDTGNSTSAVSGDSDQADYSESNYDEFSGYGGEKLFTTNYEEDDVEADQIYNQVDEAMENRRRRAREQQLLLSQKRAKLGLGAGERPRIADQFIDLKRELVASL
jgi:pre-mRNA-processing factor 6